MSESSLVTKKAWANNANYEVGRAGYKIKGIVIHHAVTTSISAVDATFANASRQASAHYTVGGKEIHQHVSEANTAWHCGNWYGNHATVGIETVNSTLAPDYKVSDQSLDTLIKLVADIAKRNGLGKLKLDPKADYPLLSGHKDWYGAATACPGPYLYPKLQYIADKANAINYPPTPSKPTLTWTKLDKVKTYKCKLQPTNLWDFNHTKYADCKSMKKFNKGDKVDIYGKVYNKELNATYLLTEYSFTKKITNGFNAGDMEEVVAPAPQPVAPSWSDIDAKTLAAKDGINLYDVMTGRVVATYKKGTEVTVVQKTNWNGVEYLRTEWSKEKKLDNGFKSSDLEEITPPAPEPEPTPAPEPEPNPEDPTVGILQKIIDFIKHIIDLITEKK